MHGESFSFDILGISKIFKCQDDERLSLPGYHKLITQCRDDGLRGGVGLFIKDNINYKVREDISVFTPHIFESLFIEIIQQNEKKTQLLSLFTGQILNHEHIDIFAATLFDLMGLVDKDTKHCVIMGDMNIDLLEFGFHNKTSDYLDNIFSHGFLPTITKPTRISHTSATLIDHIYTNNITTTGKSGIIITDVTDHFGTFHMTHIFNTLKRAMKIQYYRTSLEENKHNIKKTWTILRQAIGKMSNKANLPHIF